MRITGIMATTELAKRGDIYIQVTEESLEEIAKRVEGLPMGSNHNPTLLPLGKTKRAWVERSEENGAALHQETYLNEEPPVPFIHEISGSPCVRIPFSDSPARFHLPSARPNVSLSVDMSAIQEGNHETLIEEIRSQDENINTDFHDRREAIPIPLVEFLVDQTLTETLYLALKIAILRAAATGQLARWVEQTAKWFANSCIPAIRTYRQHKNQEAIAKGQEWIALDFDARSFDGPVIQLVIPSTHDTELPTASIEQFAKQITSFRDLLPDCDKIVFTYHQEEDKCEFRYALMKNGGVIGSQECYEESAIPHISLLASMRTGTSTWWTLVTRDNGELAIDLYKLGADGPKRVGCLATSPDMEGAIRERFEPDDGQLRPMIIDDQGKMLLWKEPQDGQVG